MRWIASVRSAPIYIWAGDSWYNETDGFIYYACLERLVWHGGSRDIPFLPKAKVFYE